MKIFRIANSIDTSHGNLFRCHTAPWKYSYMLGGMVFENNRCGTRAHDYLTGVSYDLKVSLAKSV